MAIMEQVQDLAENIKALRRWILKNIHIREPFLNDGTEYPEKMKHAAFTGSVIGVVFRYFYAGASQPALPRYIGAWRYPEVVKKVPFGAVYGAIVGTAYVTGVHYVSVFRGQKNDPANHFFGGLAVGLAHAIIYLKPKMFWKVGLPVGVVTGLLKLNIEGDPRFVVLQKPKFDIPQKRITPWSYKHLERMEFKEENSAKWKISTKSELVEILRR